MKRFLGLIEIAVIALLVFLLSLNFKRISEDSPILTAEHRVAVQTDNGLVVEGDSIVYIPETVELTESGTVTEESETGTGEPETGTETQTATSEPAETEEAVTETGDTETAGDAGGLTDSEQKIYDSLSDDYLAKYKEFTELTIPDGIAFAKVEESLGIREEGVWDAALVGTMKPYDSCIVNSTSGEWANITTGKVTGYCRAKYLITGDEAKTLAAEKVIRTATTTANVNIRSSATTQEDNTITSVTKGQSYRVLTPVVFSDDPDAPLFVEISYNGGSAYVAIGKVSCTTSFPVGTAE